MEIEIKKMETDGEIRGKAYVHWSSWHDTYPGLVSPEYLDQMTLERCEKRAFEWLDGVLVAKDGRRVVGFVGYGTQTEGVPGMGEVYALYVLKEYRGKGVGRMLMDAALKKLEGYDKVCLWALKGNKRAEMRLLSRRRGEVQREGRRGRDTIDEGNGGEGGMRTALRA